MISGRGRAFEGCGRERGPGGVETCGILKLAFFDVAAHRRTQPSSPVALHVTT